MKTYSILFSLFLILLLSCLANAQDCPQAERLTEQALNLGTDPATFPQQTQLLNRALELCPQSANAHNLLGSVLEEEGAYEQALTHYQEAARLKPDWAAAWFGVGEMYYQTGRFPLALDAFLHACPGDVDARQRIAELLKDNRYQVAPDGTILDKESLLLLFDRERRDEMNRMLEECRFRSGDDFAMRGVSVEPAADFPNILFDLGKATLQAKSLGQIREIAAALQEFGDIHVIVNGHTDQTGFAGITDPEENRRRNLELSQDRAKTVKQQLAELGIPENRIETQGYGFDRPLFDAVTHPLNRRVEILVR